MPDDRPVTSLVGMPGSGKTTVGELLAERLGVPFRDLDELVVLADGRDIPTIFAADGEAGFRTRERAALATVVDAGESVVLSTGGGVVTDAGSRDLLARTRCVHLRASLATLEDRVESSGVVRPLLADDPAGRLAALAAQRADRYLEVAGVVVDTDGLTASEVVDEIVGAGVGVAR